MFYNFTILDSKIQLYNCKMYCHEKNFSFLLFHLIVHSSLGYKDVVKSVYERKLVEGQTEAQQDPQYLLRGDVSG